MNDPRHTAIHEAGHAVIGRVLGMTCGSVSIIADHEWRSLDLRRSMDIRRTWGAARHYRDISLVFRGRILAYMAGAEAQKTILGHCEAGDGDDQRKIEMMSSQPNFTLEQWQHREPHICERQPEGWSGITGQQFERVADVLLVRGALSAEQIGAIMR